MKMIAICDKRTTPWSVAIIACETTDNNLMSVETYKDHAVADSGGSVSDYASWENTNEEACCEIMDYDQTLKKLVVADDGTNVTGITVEDI